MLTLTLNNISTIFLSLAGLTLSTRFKADEYKSGDCNFLNYSHDGDMYKWQGFPEKTKNGGEFVDDPIDNMLPECNNLDYRFRIDGEWK
ncbi:hypothetical protein F4819DRAFT_484738 [Hypoxylon fuscum]|nr:hypothetical protein F4819DRAFT_484738 [Hypoxylon fuscum]